MCLLMCFQIRELLQGKRVPGSCLKILHLYITFLDFFNFLSYLGPETLGKDTLD